MPVRHDERKRSLNEPYRLIGGEPARRLRVAMAARIKKARVKNGVTIREICEDLDIVTMTWWGWENGKRAIPSDLIPRIGKLIGVTVAHIFGTPAETARRAA